MNDITNGGSEKSVLTALIRNVILIVLLLAVSYIAEVILVKSTESFDFRLMYLQTVFRFALAGALIALLDFRHISLNIMFAVLSLVGIFLALQLPNYIRGLMVYRLSGTASGQLLFLFGLFFVKAILSIINKNRKKDHVDNDKWNTRNFDY